MDNSNQIQPEPTQVALAARPSSKALARRGYYASEKPYSFEAPDEQDDGKGIFDYWQIIVRRKKTVLLSSLAGIIIAVAACVPLKPVYRAQTSLEVLSLNQDFMNMKEASPTTNNDGSYETSEETTQAKLLQSVTLSKRVFAKLLPESAATRPKKRATLTGWRALFHIPEHAPVTPREVLLDKAAASLKVKETTHARVLEITVDSTDPDLAADYANTLTHEFIAENAEQRWQSTQNTSDWLRRELEDARNKLRHSEDDLQSYARNSGIIFTDESTNVATEKLQQLQQELSAATADRIAKQSRFELAQSSPPESLADVLNDLTLRDTQTKINDLNRQMADLSVVYSPKYSKYRRMQAERDSLQAAFNDQRSEILDRIKTDFEESQRKERLLSAAYNTQTREVGGQGEKTIQYNILKREVESNRQLYDTMLQQMKQSSIASAMRASNVRIVDAADVPDMPVFPNYKIAGAVGMLGGLFLSSIVVIIRDQLDRTLQQPGDIKLWADLSELGAIPNASIQSRLKSYGPAREQGKIKTIPSRPKALSYTGKHDLEPAGTITLQSSPGMLAEAFRSALTSILFAGESGSGRRILLFTSVNAADGKTTAVSNLALAAAEIRLKVLIIDADLRRPRMHHLFNLPNETGLSELLHGEASASDMQMAVQATHLPNLHVVTAGLPTLAAAHLLYSPNLSMILKQFAAEYDMILIDTPPMMEMTDARIVARHADSVVLVARAGQTSRDALIAAKERLQEDQIHVLGSLLNDWDPRQANNHYSYSYSRYSSRYSHTN